MKFLILSEWKFSPKKHTGIFFSQCGSFLFFRFKIADHIPGRQCISLILDSGECFVRDLEPIEYLAAYDQNDRLNYDWELIMYYAPKKIYYAHANEKIL